MHTELNVGPSNETDREARIEQLLLAGLDQDFAGKYEQAINIWTRVAFLERGHGRARAYIERARRAQAELQRESDELLHTGVAAYHAGDLQSARDLLTRAVDEGGANETALIFLQRLGRLESVSQSPRRSAPAKASALHVPSRDKEGARKGVTLVASVVVAATILLGALPAASWLAELPVDAPAASPAPPEPLPIVRGSDMRIDRARELYSAGRLRDALRVLEDVNIADPLRSDADRLRADVQRALLTAASAPPAAAAGETPR